MIGKKTQNGISFFKKKEGIITTIPPDHYFVLIMQVYFLFIIVFRLFIWTVKLSFFVLTPEASISLVPIEIYIAISVSFILELCLNFNTGFYKE
jgi:hypothetical protein